MTVDAILLSIVRLYILLICLYLICPCGVAFLFLSQMQTIWLFFKSPNPEIELINQDEDTDQNIIIYNHILIS